MWCGKCQSDVVAEVAPDNRRVLCSSCGGVLGETAISQLEAAQEQTPVAPPQEPVASAEAGKAEATTDTSEPPTAPPPITAASRAEEARQLLERWATSSPPDTSKPMPAAVSAPDVSLPSTSNPPPEFLTQVSTGSGVGQNAPPPPSPTGLSSAGQPSSAIRQSDAELDRLTNEILARVSRMTNSVDDSSRPTGEREREDVEADSRFDSADDQTPGESPVPAWRVDSGHARNRRSHSKLDEQESPDGGSPEDAMTNEMPADRSGEPGPDLDQIVRDSLPPRRAVPAEPAPTRKRGSFGRIGQGLAYLGILCLVAGAAMATVGFLRGPIDYARTGWLASAVGQMLLFLGIIELVSSGMQQTSDDLHEKMESEFQRLSHRLDTIQHELSQREDTRRSSKARPRARSRSAGSNR